MTYLQIINNVLRKLREDEASSSGQSSYVSLIGDFVNETKREVEDAWDWVQLRTTIQVTTSASIWRYTLTGAGTRFRILQVINDTEDLVMIKAPYKWMNKQFTTVGTVQQGSPQFYDINGSTDGDPNVDLYPIPNAIEVINFNLVLPQDDFTEDTTELSVPSYPVILGAYAKALSERGEDGGVSYDEAQAKYEKALSDAIAIDASNVQEELIWEVE